MAKYKTSPRSVARVQRFLFSIIGFIFWLWITKFGVTSWRSFLEKFEAAVDYHSTARVLDLLWAAVGIAINIYIAEKEILLSEIMDEENTNICLKV